MIKGMAMQTVLSRPDLRLSGVLSLCLSLIIGTPSGFRDKAILFEDDFWLPRSVDLYTVTGQSIMQYRVERSTNVLGRSFPVDFHLAQYRPAGTNGWELYLTARGKVTAVGVGAKPQIHPDAEPGRALKIGVRATNNPLYVVRAGGPSARHFEKRTFRFWLRRAVFVVLGMRNAESQRSPRF